MSENEERLKKIDETLATHSFYIPQLLHDVRALKAEVTSLSDEIMKLKRKLKKLESKVE
jgi:peptidoglycan hydrolase CwlO-like protein